MEETNKVLLDVFVQTNAGKIEIMLHKLSECDKKNIKNEEKQTDWGHRDSIISVLSFVIYTPMYNKVKKSYNIGIILILVRKYG